MFPQDFKNGTTYDALHIRIIFNDWWCLSKNHVDREIDYTCQRYTICQKCRCIFCTNFSPINGFNLKVMVQKVLTTVGDLRKKKPFLNIINSFLST